MSTPDKFFMPYTALIFKQFTESKLPLQNNVPSCCADQDMSCVSCALVLKMLSVMLTAFLSVIANTQLPRKGFAYRVLL